MKKLTKMEMSFSNLEKCDLGPDQIDCCVAVMLKILDGKCKMVPTEKVIMEALYDHLKEETGHHLHSTHHQLIQKARHLRNQNALDDEMIDQIYECRLYAETMISRPVMKGFKAALRDIGILPRKNREPLHV